MTRPRFSVLLAPLVILMLILSACGGSTSETQTGANASPGGETTGGGTGTAGGNQQAGAGMVEQLDFGGFGGGSNPQVNYNPFSPNALTAGYTFEPLLVFNNYSCEAVPWLASSYEWKDAQNLEFTIRDGVKWNDGQPFTAEDVVFTYNLLKANAAFDSPGLWRTLESVTSNGNKVAFKFKEPAANMLLRVVDIKMVPKHIWEKEQDPVTFVNEGAVGTGPFKPASFNGQQLVLERNPDYWQADKIKVNKLIFHKSAGNQQAEQLNLSQGKYDTNAMFVPNIKQVYVDKDPEHNHYWFPPGGAIALGFNLTKPPFNDIEFRRAVAHAIDRDSIVTKAQFGYVKKASQTGLVLPGQKDWLAADIPNEGMIPYDAQQAAQILEQAGYKKDANGKLLDKAGQPIEFTFLVQNGWVDWIQAAQIVQQNLNALGMTVNVQTPAPENVENERALGNFDLVFAVHGGSCSMYENFYVFGSPQSAPVGEKATINYVRFENPEMDKLIDQLRQSPDEAAQKQAVAGMQKIIFEQFPTIPLWYGANWFQYSTRRAVGWPSEQDPYAKPGDSLLVITHLQPAAQ